MDLREAPHCKAWVDGVAAAGNRLDGFEPLWVFNVGAGFPFAFAAKVNVHVAAEGRQKDNEFILSRPDIGHVVAVRIDDCDPLNSDVLVVREYRATSRTADGFIRECPGGSGFKPATPRENAVKELREETGLDVEQERLVHLGSKQVCGTFSTHKAHVYMLKLTPEEVEAARRDGAVRGVESESERTRVEVVKARDLMSSEYDWANTGMVLAALVKAGEG